MARKIVVTSGKGGVGKTTVVAGIGYSLAKKKKRVVLVDVDIGLNNLDVITGIEDKIIYDIADIVCGKCRVKQALVQDNNYPNLYILPSAHSYNKSQITSQNIKKIIAILSDYFDFVIIDSPAGIDEPFARAIGGADEAIIVVTPHLSSLRDADKVLMLLSMKNIEKKFLIVNRVRGDMLLNNEVIDSNKIAQMLDIQLLGSIPEDDEIIKLSYMEEVIKKHSESVSSLDLIAKNILGESNKIYDCTQNFRGLSGVFRRIIRRNF